MKHQMTGVVRRIALATALGSTAVLISATPAGAGAPTRIDAEYWGITCASSLGGDRSLYLFGSGTTDGVEGGVGAFIEDSSGAILAEGTAEEFDFGTGFQGDFRAAIDLGGETLAVEADLVRSAAVTTTVDERDGNRWTKGTSTQASVAVTPTSVTFDGTPIELDEGACTADVNGFDVRTTNPAAYVLRERDFDSAICDVEGLADAQVRVSGALPDAYVEVVLDHGGEDVEKVQGEVRVKGGRGTLSADVLDVFTGEVRTTARIGLVLERSGRTVREVESDGGSVQRRTLTPYRETITVSLADGRKGTATCSGVAVTTQVRFAPAG